MTEPSPRPEPRPLPSQYRLAPHEMVYPPGSYLLGLRNRVFAYAGQFIKPHNPIVYNPATKANNRLLVVQSNASAARPITMGILHNRPLESGIPEPDTAHFAYRWNADAPFHFVGSLVVASHLTAYQYAEAMEQGQFAAHDCQYNQADYDSATAFAYTVMSHPRARAVSLAATVACAEAMNQQTAQELFGQACPEDFN